MRIFFLQEGSYRDKDVESYFDIPEGTVAHSVKKQSITNYDAKDSFKKDLYFLIPFYFNKLAEELSLLCSDYIVELDAIYGTVSRRLKNISEGEITSYEKQIILDLSERILGQIAYRAGVFEAFFMLVRDGFFTTEKSAEELKIPQEEFDRRFKLWMG